MLIRRIHDQALSQATYLLGCESTREAIVVDPARDIDRYFRAAESEGVRITAVAETHQHADFVSGAQAFARLPEITLYLPGCGGHYGWIGSLDEDTRARIHLLADETEIAVGTLRIRAIHTPGHTRESMSYAVLDRHNAVCAILTGDFLFAGEVGRPDLGSRSPEADDARANAGVLRNALLRLGSLSDDVEVLPGHSAGSLCGKSICALPITTLGIERRINAPLREASDEQSFLERVLVGLPDPPSYFRRVKRHNIAGINGPHALPDPPQLSAVQFVAAARGSAAVVVDCREWGRFAEGFLTGAISAPLDKYFAMSVGSYLEQGDSVLLVVEPAQREETVRILYRLGLDTFDGWIAPSVFDAVPESALDPGDMEEISASEAHRRMESSQVMFVDTRNCIEFESGHVRGAIFAPFSQLPDKLGAFVETRPLICYCRSGNRSARACAYLRRMGFDAVNMRGGYWPWAGRGYPIEVGPPPSRARC